MVLGLKAVFGMVLDSKGESFQDAEDPIKSRFQHSEDSEVLRTPKF